MTAMRHKYSRNVERDGRIYHDDDECPSFKAIPEADLIDGTGGHLGYRKCGDCKRIEEETARRLRGEGDMIHLPPAPTDGQSEKPVVLVDPTLGLGDGQRRE